MYNEIVENIQRNLSGNSDLDKDYLVSQLDFYKNHEYAPQITKEISRLFWECLSPSSFKHSCAIPVSVEDLLCSRKN